MKKSFAALALAMSFMGFSASAEILKGKALEAKIVNMGVCVGVKTMNGRELVFKKGGVLELRGSYIDESMDDTSSYSNEYDNSYSTESGEESSYDTSYEGSYGSEQEGEVVTLGKWSVKGSSVIVKEGRVSYDIVIGFKSKTCWTK